MLPVVRIARSLAALVFLGLPLLGPVPAAIAAEEHETAEDDTTCAVTAYPFDSAAVAKRARDEFADNDAYFTKQAGTQLSGKNPREALPVKRGTHWVLVVDSSARLGEVSAQLRSLGGRFTQYSFDDDVRGQRVVIGPWELGTPRSTQLTVDAEHCAVAVRLAGSYALWGSIPAILGTILALVLGTVAVYFARRVTGYRVVNTLIAVPLAAIAGLGEMLVLYESGLAGPTSEWPFLVPILAALIVLIVACLPQPRRPKRLPKPIFAPPPGPPPVTVPPGAVLGRYRPIAPLGQGATGTTYRAIDPATGGTVALKVLSPQLCANQQFVARFFGEAETMQRLGDPHCVRLLDFVTVPGALTIVTEFVDGISLRDLLRRAERLTGEQALGVFRGALLGLRHVHEHGLVHRDVKPDNIMLDRTGESRLIDYGLARPAGRVGESAEGSPSYMSPEQIRNEPLDARSDIYACGMVLAELLTGRRIFTADTVAATVNNHLNNPAPDLASSDAVPAALAAVVATATAKSPAQRYSTVDDFLEELEAAAVEVHGADWLTHAGVTGVVSGIVAAASGASTAGAGVSQAIPAGAGTGAPAAAAGGPVAGGPVAGGPVTTPAGAGIAGDGASAGTLLNKLTSGLKVAVGTAVAAGVAAVAVVAQPAIPAAAAGVVITPEQARVVFAQTWQSIQDVTFAGRVADSAFPAVEQLYDEQRDLGLSIVDLHVPAQTSYPAYFIGYGDLASRSRGDDGHNAVAHFSKAAADKPWLLTGLTVLDRRAEGPQASTDDRGFVVPSRRAPGSLVVEPAQLSSEYANYLDASVRGAPPETSVFAAGPHTDTAARTITTSIDIDRASNIHSQVEFSAGRLRPQGVIRLSDRAATVTFTVQARFRSSNSVDNPDGVDCATAGFISPAQRWVGIADGQYRAYEQTVTFLVSAQVDRSEVTVLSTASVRNQPKTVEC